MLAFFSVCFFVNSARRPGLSGLCCRSPRVRFVPFGALVSAEGSGGSCAAIHTVGGRSAREGRITPRQRRATSQPAHTHTAKAKQKPALVRLATRQRRSKDTRGGGYPATQTLSRLTTLHSTSQHTARSPIDDATHTDPRTRARSDTLTTPDLAAKVYSSTFINL